MQLNKVLQAIGCGLSVVVLLITSHQSASAVNQTAVSTVFAVMVKRIETKSPSPSRSGELSPSSKVESTAALGATRINGEMRKSLLLHEDSQGAIGFSGLSLSWRLTTPPAVTVFRNSSSTANRSSRA